MKGEYREANSIQEIQSIIEENEFEHCIVWQTIEGKRKVYSVNTMKIDDVENGLVITLDHCEHLLSKDQLLYVKLSYRGTMFKTKIKKIGTNSIITDIPHGDNVKTIELRAETRISLDLNEERLVSLSFVHKGKEETENELRFQVVDISDSGISLIVSNQNKNFIENCQEFVLTHLAGQKLSEPIKLEKRHMADFRYKKLGKIINSNRVGFKLNSKFIRDELISFIEIGI